MNTPEIHATASWNHRFFGREIVECYYNTRGLPDGYCDAGLLYDNEETKDVVSHWQLKRIEIDRAINCATAYVEAGYPDLEEEFKKPLAERTPCPKFSQLFEAKESNIVLLS